MVKRTEKSAACTPIRVKNRRMHRNPRWPLIWLGILGLAAKVATGAPPNILFIYTDDQAPHAVRAAGDERFITPNIDRIFHEGAHLTNSFVVTPVCSPSRLELIASRYGSEMGITDWINPRSEPEVGIPEGTPTWPKLLADAGYRTALFGKWHLGTQDRHHPTQFGYERFAGMRAGGCPPKNPTLETADGTTQKLEGFTCDILTGWALDFIRESSEKPFAVSLHFRAPHAAWLPVRPEDWAPFENLDPAIPNPDFPDLDVAEVKRRTREYLAAVLSIDRNVGRVLGLLDELEIAQNTIVVFTSDHGYNLGEHGVWYKGNAIRVLTKNPAKTWPNIPANRRPNLWDTSIRVPAAIRWPEAIAAGTKMERIVCNLDWFPTLLALAGVKMPDGLEIRGRDFSRLLVGPGMGWNDELFLEYSMHHGAKSDMRGWRTSRWKYLRDFANAGREELYDLAADPGETQNLAHREEHRDVRRRFADKITAKLNELGTEIGAGQPTADNREMVEFIREMALKSNPTEGETAMRDYRGLIPKADAPYEMVAIPGGEFLMGSPVSEAGRNVDEGPRRRVKVKPFWMGKYEVTWNQYEPFIFTKMPRKRDGSLQLPERRRHGSDLADLVSSPTAPYIDPTFGMGSDGYPALCMTQHAASKFCQWLSAQTGHFYRLPTEAEWEYACRAGTTSAYTWGDDPSQLGDHGWFWKNSDEKTQPVGKKKPNPWGLHDMYGNVLEWCLDQYFPNAYFTGQTTVPATKLYPRVCRGGSWIDGAEYCRSAARIRSHADWKMQDPEFPKSMWHHSDGEWLGFRIVRPLEVPSAEEMEALWNSGKIWDEGK